MILQPCWISLFKRLGHLECGRVVGEVGTVVLEYVGKAEAEFYLRVQFEEWQIEISPPCPRKDKSR